jgi:hypothetical protein
MFVTVVRVSHDVDDFGIAGIVSVEQSATSCTSLNLIQPKRRPLERSALRVSILHFARARRMSAERLKPDDGKIRITTNDRRESLGTMSKSVCTWFGLGLALALWAPGGADSYRKRHLGNSSRV